MINLVVIHEVLGYDFSGYHKIERTANDKITIYNLVDWLNHENQIPEGVTVCTSYYGKTLYLLPDGYRFTSFLGPQMFNLEYLNHDCDIMILGYQGIKHLPPISYPVPFPYPLFRHSAGHRLASFVPYSTPSLQFFCFWPYKHTNQLLDGSVIILLAKDFVADTSQFNITVEESMLFSEFIDLLMSYLPTVEAEVINNFSQDGYWEVEIIIRDTDNTIATFPLEVVFEGVNCRPLYDRVTITGTFTIKINPINPPPPTGTTTKLKIGFKYFSSAKELELSY